MIGQGGISPVPGGAQGTYPQYNGIFYGAVSNNTDPLKQNRCILRVPMLLGSATTTWAKPLTPLVDPPKVGTLVCCLFVGGDLDFPVYLVVNPAVPIESNSANVQPVGTTAAAGTSHKVAAADHVHTLANALESTTANISKVGVAATAGTSSKAARGDHAHDPSGVQQLGSGGFNEISSSTFNGTDTPTLIDMWSQHAGGSAIELTATTTTVSNNLQMNGTLTVGGAGNFTGGLTSQNLTTVGDVTVNGNTLTVGNGGTAIINLNPPMATPPNYPLTTSGGTTQVNNVCALVNALVASMQNRGLVN